MPDIKCPHCGSYNDIREIVTRCLQCNQNLFNQKTENMKAKYSKSEFDGYTHRFIVRFSVDNDWRNDTTIDIYSNSDSFDELYNFINNNKKERVVSFKIIYRASKEDDEANARLIEEFLKTF